VLFWIGLEHLNDAGVAPAYPVSSGVTPMDSSHSDPNQAASPGVSRRAALLALGWATAASATVAATQPLAADEPAAGGGAGAGPQAGYRETDHIRRFYDCARF
jgi:hypothetical protein